MNDIVIHISWEHIFGVMFSLIMFAWYANGRFTALETSMQWMKDALVDLKIATERTAMLKKSD